LTGGGVSVPSRWTTHIVVTEKLLTRLDPEDACAQAVARFHDALLGVATDTDAALATRHLEPALAVLSTWSEPTTPRDPRMIDIELPDDLRVAVAVTDVMRAMGAIMALTALLAGPNDEIALAYAAAAVAVYAGHASGLGWVSGYRMRDEH
jgi:hypothetical protein